jgi:hypothetical protein
VLVPCPPDKVPMALCGGGNTQVDARFHKAPNQAVAGLVATEQPPGDWPTSDLRGSEQSGTAWRGNAVIGAGNAEDTFSCPQDVRRDACLRIPQIGRKYVHSLAR